MMKTVAWNWRNPSRLSLSCCGFCEGGWVFGLFLRSGIGRAVEIRNQGRSLTNPDARGAEAAEANGIRVTIAHAMCDCGRRLRLGRRSKDVLDGFDFRYTLHPIEKSIADTGRCFDEGTSFLERFNDDRFA